MSSRCSAGMPTTSWPPATKWRIAKRGNGSSEPTTPSTMWLSKAKRLLWSSEPMTSRSRFRLLARRPAGSLIRPPAGLKSCTGVLDATNWTRFQTCLAYVDAQNEYAEKDRTGAGPGVYAQRIVSSSGKKDGLYWPASDGDASPLGEFVAQASAEGYKAGQGRTPYHGYYYRILTQQGPNAPGGTLSYVVKGKMIGGYALLAYPAEYGNSGVMTFLVNYSGTVYQKDLGDYTMRLVSRMLWFDPDQTWKKVDVPGR